MCDRLPEMAPHPSSRLPCVLLPCLYLCVSSSPLRGGGTLQAADEASSSAAAGVAAAAAAVDGSSWMSALPDDLRLGAFSIPGSHDTMALHETVYNSAQTQSMGLQEQLEAGVRFLDIRCRHVSDRCAIHHGQIYQKANLNDVLTVVSSFLLLNPGETILMSVKDREWTDEKVSRSFTATFLSYARAYPGLFADNELLRDGAPELGSVRGRIVLIRRFGLAGLDLHAVPADFPLGLSASPGFAYNAPKPESAPPYTFVCRSPLDNSTWIRAQDWCDLDCTLSACGTAFHKKSLLMEGARREAAASSDARTLYLNFGNAVDFVFGGIPTRIRGLAESVNTNMHRLLTDPLWEGIAGNSGVYIFDFVTPSLARDVYSAALRKFRAAA